MCKARYELRRYVCARTRAMCQVVKKMQKSDFQSQFSMSKIIRILDVFGRISLFIDVSKSLSLKADEVSESVTIIMRQTLGGHFMDIFDNFNFQNALSSQMK